MEIVKLVLVIIPATMAILSGLLKLSHKKPIIEKLAQVGVAQYAVWLGLAELLFAGLFIYPATRNLGFILLACYFSGALATDLSHRSSIIAPLLLLVLLFVAAYVNNPGLFI